MKKYLFIDGSNMCYRTFWTHRTLTHKDSPVGLLFGFFKNLISLKKTYPEHIFVIVWDSKSARRNAQTVAGVEQGILTCTYKSARKERSEETDELFKDMFSQMERLKESLSLMNAQQIFKQGFEADDIIYTYSKTIDDGEILIITSDKDYYQLLEHNVQVLDPIKKLIITKDSFIKEYGIQPSQWVDVGGISGDKGDSIQGAEGWGEITALKYVKEYGTMENVIKGVEAKILKNKKEESLLTFKERISLAKSLKQMDIVPDLPKIEDKIEVDKNNLKNFFIGNGFCSLLLEVGRLVS